MPTQTTNFGLDKPLVNDATDEDLWGGQINTDMDDIDGLLLTALNWTASSQASNFTVTAMTSGSITTGSAKTIYLINATSGNVTASLPAASTASGLTVAFKRTDNSANTVTIQGHSTDNIDGSNTQTLSAQYSFMVLACDGTEWNIIAQTAPAINAATTSTAGIVKLATSTIVQTGTDAAAAVTASALTGNMSLGTSGYFKLPGGLTIQWGTGSLANNASVTFPTAFASACYNVTPSHNTTQSDSLGATSVSTTGFTLARGGSADSIFWMAIGK